MARVTQLDDFIEEFIVLVNKHLDEIEQIAKRSRKTLKIRSPNGQVARNAKKIGDWYYEAISIYFAHLDESYLRISLYDDLYEKNKAAYRLAGRIAKRASKLSDDVSSKVVVLIGLEAHHFIPQTVLKDFFLLQQIFGDMKTMPAINLTKLEHRGSLEVLKKLRQGDALPGLLTRLPEGQRIESVTTALNAAVAKVRQDFPFSSSLEDEKRMTLALLDEIEKVYESRFPELMDTGRDMQGDSTWTVRKWLGTVRQSVNRYQL